MSIEHHSVMLYGKPFLEIKNAEDLYNSNTLSIIQPYFDASDEDTLIGVVVYKTYSSLELSPFHLLYDIENAAKKFKEITGTDGILYITNHAF